MNATLEAMARALFQSWFVDFDPVRAKLDGRKPPGLDAVTAALFPAHFQDSPLGPIPQGWTVEPVGDVADCVGGGTPSTAEPKYWDGGTHHWTTPKDFSSLQAPILLNTDRKLTDAGIAKISSGLLPVGTLLLSSRAPVGYKNVAAELLAKLLKDEVRKQSTRNLVLSRTFAEMLQKTLNAYHNRAIATQEVIEELIKLAKQMSVANQRGVDLGLTDDEVAFYDALAVNDSAVQVMGIDELKVIAAELVTQVRKNVTIDWTVRESARAKIKVMVKRILRKYGYPPDLQEEATKTVLAQAELLCANWA